MQTYPELNVTNSAEQSTNRWMLTVLGQADFNRAYLIGTFVAATNPRIYMDAFRGEDHIPVPRPDASASEQLYAFDALPDLDELAAAQGVQPIYNIDDLATDFWPEDESVEDFIAAATEGRREEDELDS